MDESSPAKPDHEPVFDPKMERMIEEARTVLPLSFSPFVFTLVSGVLLWCSFTPLDWGPLAWVALVPVLLLCRLPQRLRWMHRLTFLAGVVFWLVTLQWMRLGDASMIIALLAMAIYLGLYWSTFLWITRALLRSFKIPLFVAAPVTWVGLEYLRGHLFTGFSWYLIGHTQYRWVEMTQISDLFGGYGVSFVVVLANAAIAVIVPDSFLVKWRLMIAGEQVIKPETESPWNGTRGLIVASALVILSVGYGYIRRGSVTFEVGPRVGLVQGNYVASLDPRAQTPPRDQFEMHWRLTEYAVSHQPDVIFWPEVMYPYPISVVEDGVTDEELESLHENISVEHWRHTGSADRLEQMSKSSNAALCIGASTFLASHDRMRTYNSAYFVTPKDGINDRYDKIHRVPFGEYIPFRETVPFIQSLTPFRGEFGIAAGDQIHVFEHGDWRFIPLICFEDTVPHLARGMVSSAEANGSPQVDVLVNLTNDGWFHGSSELDQHLITASFRCIENRTPMVRSANTGISAIIDGDGVVREPDEFFDLDSHRQKKEPRESLRDPATNRYHKQLNCVQIGDVPLDPRQSLYTWWGDWLAALCLVIVIATGLHALIRRSA